MTSTNLKNQIRATDMMDLMLSVTLKCFAFEELDDNQRAQADVIMEKSVELKDRIKKLGKDLEEKSQE